MFPIFFQIWRAHWHIHLRLILTGTVSNNYFSQKPWVWRFATPTLKLLWLILTRSVTNKSDWEGCLKKKVKDLVQIRHKKNGWKGSLKNATDLVQIRHKNSDRKCCLKKKCDGFGLNPSQKNLNGSVVSKKMWRIWSKSVTKKIDWKCSPKNVTDLAQIRHKKKYGGAPSNLWPIWSKSVTKNLNRRVISKHVADQVKLS